MALSTSLTTHTMRRNKMNEEIAKLLRQAYNLILNADKTDIDAFYLSVEEAQGFVAEALDLADGGK